MLGDQASLALHRSLRLKARTRQRGRQAPRRLVLVEVARFELYEVHLAGLPDSLEVPACEDRSLAQVGPQVMNEHATVDVAAFRGGSVQPDRFHLLRG